jgi:DNA mismatch endonuclease (patch repair protein)
MMVRSLAHRMGYRFRLHRRELPGKPDLVFPARRKVILVHGCFWHVHDCPHGRVKPATNAAFWANKRDGNATRDRRNLAALEAAGWSVLVIWECETRNAEPLGRKLREFLDASDARAQAASR